MNCSTVRQRSVAIALLFSGSFLMCQMIAPTADARPLYKTEFEKMYPKVKEKNKKISCSLCHPEKSKKVRNHYASALGEALKKKNEKDKKKIQAAMRDIEDKRCPKASSTFGERLKEGSIPCPHGADKRPGDPHSWVVHHPSGNDREAPARDSGSTRSETSPASPQASGPDGSLAASGDPGLAELPRCSRQHASAAAVPPSTGSSVASTVEPPLPAFALDVEADVSADVDPYPWFPHPASLSGPAIPRSTQRRNRMR